MDKAAALAAIIERIDHEVQTLEKTAQTAYSMATDSESIAENKYDTRGLEASYLAAGSAERAGQLRIALTTLQSFVLRDFDDDTPIGVSALMRLEREDGEGRWFFLCPVAGGEVVEVGGEKVTVVTPKAPMGATLKGKFAGDEITVGGGPKRARWTIEEVS